MGIALKILKSAPSWAVCDPIKLLAINNRLSEAMDTLHFDDMALTKIEKFLLRRAFTDIRKAKRREALKEWALHYALTGEDNRREKHEREILRMAGQQTQANNIAYKHLPGSILSANIPSPYHNPPNTIQNTIINQTQLKAMLEGINDGSQEKS